MGVSPSNQLQSTESICGGGALQGGGLPYGEEPRREQRLDDKKGCSLSSSNASNSSEASPVPMDGEHLPVCCLPFGLSCAHTFTKLMKPVVAFLRQRGIRLIVHLDNLIIFCNNQEMLTHQLTLIQELLYTSGLTIK